MPALAIERFDDAAAFLGAAGPHLEQSEVEHALMLGVTGTVAGGHAYGEEAPYFACIRDGVAIIAAAVRTPPFNVLLSVIDDERAYEPLALDLLQHSRPPGVLARSREARRFASTWQALTGEGARVAVRERLYRLTSVRPPAPTRGAMRAIAERDRAVVVRWLEAFEREALADDQPGDQQRNFERRLDGPPETTGMFLWEVEGRPVSITGYGGGTRHGIRVGPVYTPPEDRGRGYASALVAGVTQLLLDRRSKWVCLFTDRANPTSNHIYREIGYRPVLDAEELRFVPSEGS